jgi:small subunit ribosomal protein S6
MATRPYEIVVIVDSSLEDQAIEGIVKRTGALVTAQGGTPGRIERWGRRKLAYEIEKKADGYYFLMEATGVPANMAEIDRQLFLQDEILRHKIIKVPAAAAGRSITAPPSLEEVAAAAREAGREGRERGDRGDRGERGGGRDRGNRD